MSSLGQKPAGLVGVVFDGRELIQSPRLAREIKRQGHIGLPKAAQGHIHHRLLVYGESQGPADLVGAHLIGLRPRHRRVVGLLGLPLSAQGDAHGGEARHGLDLDVSSPQFVGEVNADVNDVHRPGAQLRHAGGVLHGLQEAHVGESRGQLPVVRHRLEVHPNPAVVIHQPVGAGRDCLHVGHFVADSLDVVLGVDVLSSGNSGIQVTAEENFWIIEVDDDGLRVRNFVAANLAEHASPGIGAVFGGVALEGELHVGGGHRAFAVMPLRTFAQPELPSQPAIADFPGLRQLPDVVPGLRVAG